MSTPLQDTLKGLPPDQARLLIDINDRIGHAIHAAHRQRIASHNDRAWGAATMLLTTLSALNSGAIIAILALIGNAL